MADRQQYMIRVKGKLVEVSPEVYYAYYRMARQEEWQEEKKKDHNVMSYDALDTDDFIGLEAIPDTDSPGVEEIVTEKDLKERLHRAIETLSQPEKELIQAIYFEGITEREYAERYGISQMGANKRHRKMLSKLRILMNFIESF